MDRAATVPEPTRQQKPDDPPPPVVPNAAVTLPTPTEAPKEVREIAPAQTASIAAPEATALPSAQKVAPQVASPPPGETLGPSIRVITEWQLKLITRLQKSKRYPSNARGAQGVALVAFTIDPKGKIIDSRILQSSGSPTLDAEAIATIKRSEPLPLPPPNLSADQLSFSLPIRYVAPAR